jgi:hypothetical protein
MRPLALVLLVAFGSAVAPRSACPGAAAMDACCPVAELLDREARIEQACCCVAPAKNAPPSARNPFATPPAPDPRVLVFITPTQLQPVPPREDAPVAQLRRPAWRAPPTLLAARTSFRC